MGFSVIVSKRDWLLACFKGPVLRLRKSNVVPTLSQSNLALDRATLCCLCCFGEVAILPKSQNLVRARANTVKMTRDRTRIPTEARHSLASAKGGSVFAQLKGTWWEAKGFMVPVRSLTTCQEGLGLWSCRKRKLTPWVIVH